VFRDRSYQNKLRWVEDKGSFGKKNEENETASRHWSTEKHTGGESELMSLLRNRSVRND